MDQSPNTFERLILEQLRELKEKVDGIACDVVDIKLHQVAHKGESRAQHLRIEKLEKIVIGGGVTVTVAVVTAVLAGFF